MLLLQEMLNIQAIYSISSNDRLLDLIERSGGYTESAYPFKASLFRRAQMLLIKQFIPSS